MIGDAAGGWRLRLRCPCGITEEARHVVPSLTEQAVERAGWKMEGGPLVRPDEQREGLCPVCAS
jgi:hypothetical protein